MNLFTLDNLSLLLSGGLLIGLAGNALAFISVGPQLLFVSPISSS